MIPEIVDKFQQYLNDLSGAIVDVVQQAFPDLSPEEQQDAPIIQSESFFAHCMFRAISKNYLYNVSDNGLYYTVDIELRDNDILFGNQLYVGKDNNIWTDAAVEEMNTAVLDNPPESFTTATGDIYAFIGSNCEFKLYAGGVYDYSKVRFKMGADGSFSGKQSSNYFMVYMNELTYSIDANNVVHPNKDYNSMNPWGSNGFLSIKNYPIVGNVKDLTSVNTFITKMGATNNYTSTYTTPDNKTITVYYGDNYIITHVNNDDPVSYNDVKNALNIAVDQINDDNDTDMSVPDYPIPTPPGIDDDIEVDMPLSDAAFGEGLSHYYVTTVGSTVLNDISAAMSTWDINNTGKDLYRNLLSCRITKVGPIPSTSSTFVIYGEELQYNGSPITITKITGNPSMDLGEYEILPKFNDFRDYAPFTKIEMFIPYCGWVSLPSHCMSSEDNPKIITGTLLCDIIAGTCKAVIKCNDTVVAEASGFTAIDVPFTGENVGMKMAGIASSITSYGNQAAKTVGSVAAGGMAGGAGAGAALAGGLVGLAGSYAQMYSAFNANYTEICGKTGDGCNVAGLGSVYIKIQRPKAGETEAPYYVPANYAHTTGFMSMKQKAISECNGLIVCANVDTSGISGATARERAEIKRLLETGIYVNLTPPEPPEP